MYEKSNPHRYLHQYRLLLCLFHRFLCHILATRDGLDALIGVHLNAFYHLSDNAVIVLILMGCFFCNDSCIYTQTTFGQTRVFNKQKHKKSRKKCATLSPQAKVVQHPVLSRFFEMISFFLHSISANLIIAKKQGNARKTPEIVRFRGFEAMISFLASLYGWDIGIRILASRRRSVRLGSDAPQAPHSLPSLFESLFYLRKQKQHPYGCCFVLAGI